MTEHANEHYTALIGSTVDEIVRHVGQDRSLTAVKHGDDIKRLVAELAERAVPVDQSGIEQLKQALLNRDAEIAVLKEAAAAPSALTEVVEGDPVSEPAADEF